MKCLTKVNHSRHVGKVFTRLTVIGVFRDQSGEYHCECVCECGTCKLVSLANLRGSTHSCGCLRSQGVRVTHGKTKSPEHRAWVGMKVRCENPNAISYDLYGARGISVFPAWRSDFRAFLEHVGPRPSPEHTLDRIDPNGNYEPGNVRWANRRVQANNKRTAIYLTWQGRTQTAAEWADELGILRPTIYERIKRKRYSVEQILSTGKLPRRGSNV